MLNYGTNLALRSQKLSYDPTRGKRLVQQWDGSRDAILVQALTLGAQVAWETDDSAAPMVTLSASSPDNDDLQTVWGMRANQLTKHMYEHPSVENNVSEADLQAIKDFISGKTTVAPSVTGSTADMLLYLMNHEQTHYIIPRFVLHMRSVGTMRNCLNAVVLDPDFAGCVFTESQLTTPSSEFFMNIDPTVVDYMKAISGPPEGDTPAGFTWGYLFQTPSLDPLPGGKHELRQEWWLGLWGTPLPYVLVS